MWLVHLALRRPYTFVCVSIMVLIFGIVAIVSMPIDIFPAINIPVVSVLWSYSRGWRRYEMEQRVVTLAERVYSSYVNDIEHIESQSLNGISIIKVYFQPDAELSGGMAQLAAASQAVTHNMPPGISPPFMLRFNATDVPILQMSVGSDKRTSAELNDYATKLRFPHSTHTTVRGAHGTAPALWRYATERQHRHRSPGALRQGALASRRQQCVDRPECDRASRYGAHGRTRVLRTAQLQHRIRWRS